MTDILSDDRLALELAEAEAAAAEADATAARARATLARLRHSEATQPREHAAEVPETEVPETEIPEAEHLETDAPDDESPTDEAPRDESPAEEPERPTAERSRRARVLARVTTSLGRLRHPTKRGVVVTAMSLVTVAALVVVALIGWNHRDVRAQQDRAAEFTAAAERGVTAIISLDYQHAERDVKRILDLSTGAFYTDFKGRQQDFTSVVQQSQVTTRGHVTASALESVDDDTAVVLVAATSDITNAAGADQEPRIWRLRVTMTDVNGIKKISKVDFVP